MNDVDMFPSWLHDTVVDMNREKVISRIIQLKPNEVSNLMVASPEISNGDIIKRFTEGELV